MSTQVPGKSLRAINYGTRVERAPATLPQTTTQSLFTVTGRVIVTTLVAEVTTVFQTQANTLTISHLGTVGSISTLLGVATDLGTAPPAAGNLISVPGVPATALTVGGAVTQGNEVILQTGVIRLQTSASSTGALRWILTYVPLDDGASVTVL